MNKDDRNEKKTSRENLSSIDNSATDCAILLKCVVIVAVVTDLQQTSGETRVARQPAGGVPSDITASMITWSKGHVSVRYLVLRRLVSIPTIVRISAAYTSEMMAHKFNFNEGTVSVHC